MIEELGWSWTEAGLGFTVLALFTGLSSTLPAYTIKKFGLRLTYLFGGCLIGLGFFIFSRTSALMPYLLGAILIGLGYSQSGAVPAVKLISHWFFKKRSFDIGLFFTSGALGGVFGPLIASYFLTNIGSWRLYWISVTVLVFILTILTTLFVPQRHDDDVIQADSDTQNDEDSWTFKEVIRTPQYYIITLATTFTILGALTMNTWQATHMQNLGVAATATAGALSAHALFNALSRITGGLIIDKVGAKLLFTIGLFAGVIGMLALAFAKTPALIFIFAMGDGISFGIVTFATSIILLEYYGVKNNPIILGFVNLITTFAMIGPVLAGFTAEKAGGFTGVFIGLSIMMLIVFILALMMKKPIRPSKIST